MAKGKDKGEKPGTKLVKKNRKAHFNFEILERLEAGLALQGPEVKSLRLGHVSLEEAFIRVLDDEAWLVGAHIDEYAQRGYAPHDPKRRRKLLLHRREIVRLAARVKERGFTLLPLSIYFKDSRAKVEVGICRGRKLYDKRETTKARDASREIQRSLGRGGRG